jgi:hypothetical protein
VALVCVAGTLAACAHSPQEVPPPTAAQAPVTVAGGGAVSLDGTTAQIPARAVSADTTVTIRDATAAPTAPPGARSIGQPVTISLDGGAELIGPVHLRLAVPSGVPADWPQDTPFTAFAAYWDGQSASWVAADSEYDQTSGEVVADVTHFSLWAPFTWDYGAIRDSVRQGLADLLGTPSSAPATCQSPPATTTNQVQVQVEGADLLDWCLDADSGGTVLRAHGKPGFPLLVSWSGTASLRQPTEYQTDLVPAYRWLAGTLGVQASDSVAIPAGGSVELTVAPDAQTPVSVGATWDPRVQLMGIAEATVRVVIALRGALGLQTSAQQAVQALLDTGCLAPHADDLAHDPAGATVTILTGCVSDVVGALTKDLGHGLLSFFGAVPKVVSALLDVVGYAANQFFVGLSSADGALLAGATSSKLTLSVGDQTTPPGTGAGSGWPEHDREGPPTFFAWLAAGNYGQPDFSSCTDDGKWCIAAFGDQVHIFSLHPMKDVGTVPRNSTDPAAALSATGLAPDVVSQLLRAG